MEHEMYKDLSEEILYKLREINKFIEKVLEERNGEKRTTTHLLE